MVEISPWVGLSSGSTAWALPEHSAVMTLTSPSCPSCRAAVVSRTPNQECWPCAYTLREVTGFFKLKYGGIVHAKIEYTVFLLFSPNLCMFLLFFLFLIKL